MPAACEALGYEKRVTCGWLESMLEALLKVDPTAEFCLLGWDARPCDVQIGRVRYVSFEGCGKGWYQRCPEKFQSLARNLIHQFKPDVIHVNGTEYFYGNMDKSVYGGRPVVISLQGLVSECAARYNGGLSWRETLCAHATNVRFWLKRASIFRTQREWATVRTRQELETLKRWRFFIGRTTWDETVLRSVNPDAHYFSVHENLRPAFYCAKRNPGKIVRYSIYCGAAAGYPLKGAHWLLRAVALLKNEFPGLTVRIATARNALEPTFHDWVHEEPYAAYLCRLIRKLRVEKHVIALPQLTAEQVVEELCRAELFVLPSLCENSPNSLGEAMLVGTPAVVTNVGGVSSMLRDEIEGKMVPAGNPEALAAVIRDCFLHPEEAATRAAVAQETARRRHDAERNARQVLDVYREVVSMSHSDDRRVKI